MTREERLNNPFNNYKSELQHIEHTMDRLKLRHGMEISLNEYYDLLKLVQKESDDLYSLNTTSSVKRVMFRGEMIWLIYGRSSKSGDFRLPSRIKTILQENFKSYPVPDRFGMKVSGEELATDVRKIIEEVKLFKTNVIPHITKKELFVEPDFDHLCKVFKAISSKLYCNKLTETDLYRGAFKIVLDSYEHRNIQRNIG